MSNGNLSLDVGSDIRLSGVKFTVEGYIVLRDLDGTKWTEYKIKSKEKRQVKWLSVDELNDEYAVYSQEPYSDEFLEENIKARGYKEVDYGSAKILKYKGNVDVDIGEEVYYKEYEDNTEELLISIENWNGESEFSKGYYIDKDEIKKLDSKFNTIQNSAILDRINKSNGYKEDKKNIGIIIAIILMVSVVSIFSESDNQDKRLSEFIESNNNFQYETSITSDIDEKRKANVYSTSKTIEEATKLLIEALQGDIEDVQENEEDGTVAIITIDEMALIYLSEDLKTLVQVSSREYVNTSRNTLYRGSHTTNKYYRRYYDSKEYSEDQNKYRAYSDSIRQSSIKSRASSGDGISSGK